MSRLAVIVLLGSALLVSACSGGGSEESSSAPRNRLPIPDVAGMRLANACKSLSRTGYHGGVRKIVKEQDSPAKTVLGILEMKAGMRGGQGQVIMLRVAGPVSIKRLPKGCVSRIPGTF